MGWGAKTNIVSDTGVTNTEEYSTAVTLNPGEVAHVEVEANNEDPSVSTDGLVVSVYGTLDDTSENWDDTPFCSFVIDSATDPNKVSFIVSGVYKFRIGYASEGTTNLFSVEVDYRKDGVNL